MLIQLTSDSMRKVGWLVGVKRPFSEMKSQGWRVILLLSEWRLAIY